MKLTVRLLCYLLFSPILLVKAIVETIIWAFDKENKPWGTTTFPPDE